jgi:hypothetical protein
VSTAEDVLSTTIYLEMGLVTIFDLSLSDTFVGLGYAISGRW